MANELGLAWGGNSTSQADSGKPWFLHAHDEAAAEAGAVLDVLAEAEAGPSSEAAVLAPKELFEAVELHVRRGLVFMVEHSQLPFCTIGGAGGGGGGGQGVDASWVLYRPPLKDNGSAVVTANSLLAEARRCASQYPRHHVRITAQDTTRLHSQIHFLAHLPRDEEEAGGAEAEVPGGDDAESRRTRGRRA